MIFDFFKTSFFFFILKCSQTTKFSIKTQKSMYNNLETTNLLYFYKKLRANKKL